MVKILCYLTLFTSIAKPPSIVPGLPFGENVFFVLASLTIVAFAMDRFMRGMPLGKLPQRKYVYALVVVYALSIAQSGWFGGTIEILAIWAKIAIVFTLVVDASDTSRDVRRLLFTVVAAVTVLAWAGWHMYLYEPELMQAQGRLQSVGNYNLSNSFALALTVASPLAFALLVTARGFSAKVVYFLLIWGFALSSVYTKSRGGNLGFAFAVLASIILSRGIRSRTFKGLLVGGAIVGIMASVPVILSRGDVQTYFGGDSSAEDRLEVWVAGVKMIRDHPLLGVGYTQFPDHLSDYGVEKKMLAHNTLLSVTAETGLSGGLLFVMIVVTTWRSLWRVWRAASRDPAQHDLACLTQGVMIGLVAFLINTNFSVKDADPIYWAILGVAGSIVVLHTRLSGEAGAAPDTPAGSTAPATSH
jgi:O-antigen ligase